MPFPQIRGTKNPSFNLVPTWFPVTSFAVVTAATREEDFEDSRICWGVRKRTILVFCSLCIGIDGSTNVNVSIQFSLKLFFWGGGAAGWQTPTLIGFEVGTPQKASSMSVPGFPNNLERVSREAFPTSIQEATGAGQSKP